VRPNFPGNKIGLFCGFFLPSSNLKVQFSFLLSLTVEKVQQGFESSRVKVKSFLAKLPMVFEEQYQIHRISSQRGLKLQGKNKTYLHTGVLEWQKKLPNNIFVKVLFLKIKMRIYILPFYFNFLV